MRVPVVPVAAKYMVSVVMAIDVETDAGLTIVIVVPIANATDELAGTVIVLPVAVT